MRTILFALFVFPCLLSAQVDQLPAGTGPVNGRSMVIVSKARSKDRIQGNYPFDIELLTTDSTSVNSAQVFPLNGKPTVVLFWLTTCFPCRMELNAIKQNYDHWKKEADFNLIAVSEDFQHNFRKFVDRHHSEQWNWPTYNDVNREFPVVMPPNGLNGLPQTFVFDKNGQIVYHSWRYSSGDEEKLFEEIRKAAAR